MEKIKEYSSIIGFVGCGLIILGCFMPFATYWGMSVKYISGDGQLVVCATVVTAILIYLKKGYWELIPAGIRCLLFGYTTINAMEYKEFLSTGFYLILVGIILTLIYPFLARKPKDEIKNDTL